MSYMSSIEGHGGTPYEGIARIITDPVEIERNRLLMERSREITRKIRRELDAGGGMEALERIRKEYGL